MVRFLIYLMIGSCSDIVFAIVILAQQMANPSNKYYQAELHLCKYQIVYDRLITEFIVAYSNSDWA